MAVFLILVIFILTAILIKSADFVVICLRRLSFHSKSNTFTLSAILLALATSFPELSVAITSSLSESPGLSLGNVLGANIANLSLVAGTAALITGRVKVHGEFMKEDVFFALLFGSLPILLMLDKSISRVDGVVLILVYLAYSTGFFKKKRDLIAKQQHQETFPLRMFRAIKHIHGDVTKDLAKLFMGIAVLLFTANLIVKFAQDIAAMLNIPIFLIGLILVSIGTTLPELAFSIRSLEDDEPTMFFGNILGSIIANSTLIIGIAAFIYPVHIFALEDYAIAIASFLVIFITFWFLIKSKLSLERWEALILIGLYIIFVILEFVF